MNKKENVLYPKVHQAPIHHAAFQISRSLNALEIEPKHHAKKGPSIASMPSTTPKP